MVDDVIRSLGLLCLGSRLKRLGERLQASTEEIVVAAGVTPGPSQHPMLVALARHGPLTVGDLAEALGVSQPGITRSLVRFEALGLVESAPAAGDQRRRLVGLTPEGRVLVDDLSRRLWPVVAAAVADLCADLDGGLLDQVAAIEDRLEARPLVERRPGEGVALKPIDVAPAPRTE